jgi:hypothetical protein
MKHKPSNWLFSSSLPFVALLAVGSAEGALLQSSGPSTTVAFDSTLISASLIYDANFYSATEGRLVIVASGSSLAGPGVTGGPAQTYLGAGDSLKDLALTLRLRNTDGALVSGSVNLPGDNNSAADSWTMAGSVTAFGWSDYVAAGTNTFDLRWGVNSYDFSDVSANPALVGGTSTCTGSNGSCGMGYMRFATSGIGFTSATTGAPVNFGIDWVRGAGVISGSTPSATLGTFDDGIANTAYANNAVTGDIFLTPVPTPGSMALMAASLAALVPLMRRRLRRD